MKILELVVALLLTCPELPVYRLQYGGSSGRSLKDAGEHMWVIVGFREE